VIDHLPGHMHSFVARKMERAYEMRDSAAKRSLSDLSQTLDAQHPGAAASLREGAGGDVHGRPSRFAAVAAADVALDQHDRVDDLDARNRCSRPC
jgi:hypothetical protein